MKSNNTFLYSFCALAVLSFVTIYSGCSDSVTNTPGGFVYYPPALFQSYDNTEAKQTMTLAAIAYVEENNFNASAVKDSIKKHLADPSYATQGKWKLAWGPAFSISKENMFYIAKDSTADTTYYCIAIRGTNFAFPNNIQQDMRVWNLVKFPYSTGFGDSIAEGTYHALDTLLAATDPETGKDIYAFLRGVPAGKNKMYITGHSLGGALATALSAWFVNKNYTSKFKLEVYTFASPTVGNETFVSLYHSVMTAANAYNHRVVNSRDVVPYLWGGIGNITKDNIPVAVPFVIFTTYTSIDFYLKNNGIVYKHVETKQDIGTLSATNCSDGSYLSQYFCWVAFEHNTNNYLRLLGADTVKYY